MPPKRNVRKMNSELKQALFSDTERFEMFFAAHWKKIAVIAVAAALLAAIIFGIWMAWRNARKQAAAELADAATVTELTAALQKHPSEPGTPVARFRLARLYIEAKDYDAAMAELGAIAEFPGVDPLLANSARLTGAYMLELKNELVRAAAAFDAIGGDSTVAAGIRAEADYAAARLHIAGRAFDAAGAALKRAAGLVENDPAVFHYKNLCRQLEIALANHEFDVQAAKPEPAAK